MSDLSFVAGEFPRLASTAREAAEAVRSARPEGGAGAFASAMPGTNLSSKMQGVEDKFADQATKTGTSLDEHAESLLAAERDFIAAEEENTKLIGSIIEGHSYGGGAAGHSKGAGLTGHSIGGKGDINTIGGEPLTGHSKGSGLTGHSIGGKGDINTIGGEPLTGHSKGSGLTGHSIGGKGDINTIGGEPLTGHSYGASRGAQQLDDVVNLGQPRGHSKGATAHDEWWRERGIRADGPDLPSGNPSPVKDAAESVVRGAQEVASDVARGAQEVASDVARGAQVAAESVVRGAKEAVEGLREAAENFDPTTVAGPMMGPPSWLDDVKRK